jgi:hypothetical protein
LVDLLQADEEGRRGHHVRDGAGQGRHRRRPPRGRGHCHLLLLPPALRCPCLPLPLPAAEARSRRHARVSSRSAVRTTSRRRAQTTLAPHLQSPTRTHPAAPAAVAQHTALKRPAQQPRLATARPTPPQRTLDCAPQRPPAPSVMRALRSRAARAPQHTQRPRSTRSDPAARTALALSRGAAPGQTTRPSRSAQPPTCASRRPAPRVRRASHCGAGVPASWRGDLGRTRATSKLLRRLPVCPGGALLVLPGKQSVLSLLTAQTLGLPLPRRGVTLAWGQVAARCRDRVDSLPVRTGWTDDGRRRVGSISHALILAAVRTSKIPCSVTSPTLLKIN